MREAAAEGATAEEMESLLRLGRAYYVIGLDHGPAIVQSLEALHRARDLAVQLGDRHGEARALIPTHRHIDFDPSYLPQARAEAYASYRARLVEYIDRRHAASPQAELDSLVHALQRMQHPTVWREMQRQQERLPLLTPLFAQVPEAVAW